MTPVKRLIVAFVFLVVAAGLFFAIKQFNIGSEETDATPTPAALLFPDAQAGTVTKVQVKDNTTQDIFAAENKDGKWTILTAPKGSDTGLGVDESRITNALASIPSIQPTRSLTGIESLATYGLGDTSKYIIALTISGRDYTLTVGSKNPGDSDYYVQLSNVSDIYLVGTYYLDSVIELLTQPPYIQPTPDPNVTPTVAPTESSVSG
jgi:hypothetical protein